MHSLGSGNFGKVYLVEERSTKDLVNILYKQLYAHI